MNDIVPLNTDNVTVTPTTEPSPHVSETEMSQFFGRIATTFVHLSSQAKELEDLKLVVQQVNARLDGVIQENTSLREEVANNMALVRSVERERDTLRQEVQAKAEQIHWYGDTLNARDQRIREMEAELAETKRQLSDVTTNLQSTQAALDNARHERDQISAQCTSEQERANRLAQDLAVVTSERDATQAQLTRITGILDSIAAVARPQQAA